MTSPFPVGTRVTLSMRAASMKLHAEGVVRVMHQERGMGVEFTQETPQNRSELEKFLEVLTRNRDVQPELLVEPESWDPDNSSTPAHPGNADDPLIGLFRNQAALPVESFVEELRKQRGIALSASASG
jgi:hypothetical protein